MYVTPEIKYKAYGTTPVYKCKCGHLFTRIDLLNNKPSKGNRNYCPNCKNKLHFE